MFENQDDFSKKNKLSVRELLLKYIKYYPFFILSLTVCIAISYLYLRYKVPVYNSGISILIDDNKGNNADMMLEGMGLPDKRPNLANETEVLRSSPLMKRVVDSLKLNISYYYNSKVKRSEIYGNNSFIFTPVSNIDSTKGNAIEIVFNQSGNFKIVGTDTWYKSGQIFEVSKFKCKVDVFSPWVNVENSYTINWNSPTAAAEAFSEGLIVSQLSKDASILNLTIKTEVPQKGQDILNELVEAYNNSTVEGKNRIVDNTVQFVDERLNVLTGELGSVEKGLKNYRERNELINVETQGEEQYIEMKEVQARLNDLEMRIRVIDMIRDYVNNPPNKFNLVPSSLGIEDVTLTALINQYNTIQLQREESLKTTPAANSIIGVMENQIEKVRLSILENLKNIRLSASGQQQKISNQFEGSRSKFLNIPSKQKGLLEITRQRGIKEQLFLFLLQKREESAITRASAVADSYALQPARASLYPVSPNKLNAYGYSITLGLLLPVLFIYLKELLNDKITTRDDIDNLTNIPVLGEITHDKEKTRKIVVGFNDRSILSEQFRVIRTNLEFLMRKEKTPVLLVTSSIGGEGKTFTCMNIGAVWAAIKKRTIILEFDLRKPKLLKGLNMPGDKGFSNFMIGQFSPSELPIEVPGIPNLFVLAAGPIPPNPSELLADEKMNELFSYLQANFDMIIIDSAPIGLVSDAKILSKFADATLYVVRQQFSEKKMLHFVNEMYNKKELPNIGLVVNDIKTTRYNSYNSSGHGYGYGYGYEYGEHEYANQEKQNWWKQIFAKKV